jgi:hypothetical protein
MPTSALGAFLEESGLVDHEDTVAFAEVFHGVGAYVVADSVGVPGGGVEQALHPVGGGVTGGVYDRDTDVKGIYEGVFKLLTLY